MTANKSVFEQPSPVTPDASGNPSRPDYIVGSNGELVPIQIFDDGVLMNFILQFILADSYVGNGVDVSLKCSASVTSNDFTLGVGVRPLVDDSDNIGDPFSYTIVQNSKAPPLVLGQTTRNVIGLTHGDMGSPTAGTDMLLLVQRPAVDPMVGSLELWWPYTRMIEKAP